MTLIFTHGQQPHIMPAFVPPSVATLTYDPPSYVHWLSDVEYNMILSTLHMVDWNESRRRNAHGHDETLGLTDSATGTTAFSAGAGCRKNVSILINSLLKSIAAKHLPSFAWTSFQNNHNTVSKPHRDSNNKGPSLSVAVRGLSTWSLWNGGW